MKCVFSVMAALVLLTGSAHADAINLGTAGTFGLLAGAGVTNSGLSIINGDVGSSPTPAVTGFPPGVVNGILYTSADPATALAQAHLTAAYNAAVAAASTMTLTGTDLGVYNAGNALGPGVYFFESSAGLTGNLTLDGGGDPNAQWIFQIGSTLTTATDSTVTFINEATPTNVFWQVGSSATLGSGSAFVSTIMAFESISIVGGGSLDGRALARGGAVTISSAENVNVPMDPVIPEPSSIIALGTMLTSAGVVLIRRR